MRIFLKVKPNSKEEKVEKVGDDILLVRVKEPPIDGKANQAVVKLLAKHFSVAKSDIKIIGGPKFKEKIVEIIK